MGSLLLSLLRSKIGGIVPVTPRESKYARASAVCPFLEGGQRVICRTGRSACLIRRDLSDESAAFPSSANDDLVDATSQALAVMLLDGNGAAAWIGWARRKAAGVVAGGEPVRELEAAAAAPGVDGQGGVPVADGGGQEEDAPLQGVVVVADPVAVRKAARDQMWRAQRGSVFGGWS